MADSRLNIVIDADTARAKREINGFKGSFTELKSQLDLAVMGFQAVRDAAVKAFEFAKQGAELDRTRGQLESLAISIGTTADTLIERMGAATGGLMSNAEMISSATQIISLGLADNETDVIRLATVVSELGWDMQQVILTFANNSTMRLDALGLSVQDVTTKAKALEEQGFDADKAFDLAVLEAAEEKIALVGSAAETAAGQYKVFEANIANVTDNLKLLSADALTPVVSGANEFFEAQVLLNDAMAMGVITSDDLNAIQTQLKFSVDDYKDSLELVRDKIENYNEKQEIMNYGSDLARLSMMAQEEAIRKVGDAADDAVPSIEDLADASRNLGDTNESVAEFIQNTIDAILGYADPEFLQAKLILESLIGLWEQGELPLDTLGILASDLQTTLEEGGDVLETAAAQYLELGGTAGGAADEVDRLNRLISSISGDYYVRLFVEQIGDISLDTSQGGIDIGDVGGLGGLPPGMDDDAHFGTDFVVPSGYNNDSYRMNVESGERVTVTPASEVASGRGGMGAPSQVIVMLDGEQIAARVMTKAGRDYRTTRANGGGYTGR